MNLDKYEAWDALGDLHIVAGEDILLSGCEKSKEELETMLVSGDERTKLLATRYVELIMSIMKARDERG